MWPFSKPERATATNASGFRVDEAARKSQLYLHPVSSSLQIARSPPISAARFRHTMRPKCLSRPWFASAAVRAHRPQQEQGRTRDHSTVFDQTAVIRAHWNVPYPNEPYAIPVRGRGTVPRPISRSLRRTCTRGACAGELCAFRPRNPRGVGKSRQRRLDRIRRDADDPDAARPRSSAPQCVRQARGNGRESRRY